MSQIVLTPSIGNTLKTCWAKKQLKRISRTCKPTHSRKPDLMQSKRIFGKKWWTDGPHHVQSIAPQNGYLSSLMRFDTRSAYHLNTGEWALCKCVSEDVQVQFTWDGSNGCNSGISWHRALVTRHVCFRRGFSSKKSIYRPTRTRHDAHAFQGGAGTTKHFF